MVAVVTAVEALGDAPWSGQAMVVLILGAVAVFLIAMGDAG